MSTQPPGWYPDPQQPGKTRWWNGNQWTDGGAGSGEEPTVEMPLQPPPPPPQYVQQTVGQGGKPWWQRTWAYIAFAVIGGLIIGSAMSSSDDPAPASATTQPTVTITAEPSASTPEPAEPTATVTETVKPKVKAAAPQPTPVEKTTAAGGNANGWIMPDEVGIDLQSAQDDLQTESGDPFYFSFSRDATGAGRGQWLDSDWVVCSQRPLPGVVVTRRMDVTFSVVRLDENCP